MSRDLATVDFDLGEVTVRLKGARWFYNDADINKLVGGSLTTEGDVTNDNFVVDKKVQYQRLLIRLVATYAKDGPAGAGNSTQADTKQIRFWCAPDFVGEAMKKLPGRNIDENLLPGSYKIQKVFPPVDSNLA